MYELRVTQSAIQDITEILIYTLLEFGENQSKKYENQIDEHIRSIGINPFIGHSRIDIPKECLALPFGGHVLVYKIENSTIFILRVLNQRMDFLNLF
ncbi:toxin ParE1/3/4 [Spirosomataceae bacterium TFI 002]|nr:toxin ParE1/3/4 [Spirosomataceae bacterium TFI 002]